VGTGIDYVTETHESQGDVDIFIDGLLKKSGQFMLLDKLNGRQRSLLNTDVADFDKNPSAQAM
jgi:hypothetical protein